MAKAYPETTDRELEEIQVITKNLEQRNGNDSESLLDSESTVSGEGEPCYKRTGFKRVVFGCIAMVLIIVLIAVVVFVSKSDSSDSPRVYVNPVQVQWQCGNVSGNEENGVYTFRGIPYAAASNGIMQNWRAPFPLDDDSCKDLQYTYNAQSELGTCFHLDVLGMMGSDPNVRGSYDCLKLNVYTPSINESEPLRPVLFFIHGGWLMTGSKAQPNWTPTPKLALELDAVVVSINYRLSVFGWLALQVFEDENGFPSGNYGLQDQLLALKWVKTNIENFRGDPNQVTVLGHGSGGTCGLALMTMQESRGLFHRAWLMSPSATYEENKRKVYIDNTYFLNKTGCAEEHEGLNETLYCLRQRMDPHKALHWSPYNEYPNWAPELRYSLPTADQRVGGVIFIDGKTLKETPEAAMKSGKFLDIPLVISSTNMETDLIQAPLNLSRWNQTDLEVAMKRLHLQFSLRMDKMEKLTESVTSVKLAHAALCTALRVTCSLDSLSAVWAQRASYPFYRLVTEAPPSSTVFREFGTFVSSGAYHGWDLQAMLGAFGDFQPHKSDRALGSLLRSKLKELMHNGKIKEWPTRKQGRSIALQVNATVGFHEMPDVCTDWFPRHKDYVWRN